MTKFLFLIFVSLSISTNVLLGEDICSHYDDKDCVHQNAIKNGHFVNQWSVHLPGLTKERARQLLEDNGFIYLGQVMDGIDLHLVTKTDTLEKHAMANEKIIELLKKHEQVHSVAQKHVIENSPDEVNSVTVENEVKCQFLDPNTIKFNDGRENWERIQTDEAAITDMTYMARPISSSHTSDVDDNGDGIGDYSQKEKRKTKVDKDVVAGNNIKSRSKSSS